MTKVLVTGAHGFVGRPLVTRLIELGYDVTPAVRTLRNSSEFLIQDINLNTNWENALRECDVVIHLAARVHIIPDDSPNSLLEFKNINVFGTMNLVRQAANAGVKRFIFLSSVKVNGEDSFSKPFTWNDVPSPRGPYAISKHEAELALKNFSLNSRMEYVIIRPPLIYGPGAKGNLATLRRIIEMNLPLPFRLADKNKRSLLAIDNLIDFIITCIVKPEAANQTFLVSDGEDLSTLDLINHVALAMGRKIFLVPVPLFIMRALARMIGRKDIAQRVLCNLQVNINKTYEVLGWIPPINVYEGFRRALAEDPSD